MCLGDGGRLFHILAHQGKGHGRHVVALCCQLLQQRVTEDLLRFIRQTLVARCELMHHRARQQLVHDGTLAVCPVQFGFGSLGCQFGGFLLQGFLVLAKRLNLLTGGGQLRLLLCQFLFHVSLAVLQVLYLPGNLLADGIVLLLEFMQGFQLPF